jgi:hypothetical protein
MTRILLQYIRVAFTRNYDKIIFLDFDGVLCLIYDEIDDKIDDGKDRFGTLFNKKCAKHFNPVITISYSYDKFICKTI